MTMLFPQFANHQIRHQATSKKGPSAWRLHKATLIFLRRVWVYMYGLTRSFYQPKDVINLKKFLLYFFIYILTYCRHIHIILLIHHVENTDYKEIKTQTKRKVKLC